MRHPATKMMRLSPDLQLELTSKRNKKSINAKMEQIEKKVTSIPVTTTTTTLMTKTVTTTIRDNNNNNNNNNEN